jgi:hypothetical protein
MVGDAKITRRKNSYSTGTVRTGVLHLFRHSSDRSPQSSDGSKDITIRVRCG